MAGTIGIRSWDERAYRQAVELPATHKQANDTDFWPSGNYIRGSKDWSWFPPGWEYDDISPQRGREDPVGFLYHLYFCKETFTEEQMNLMQKKWGTLSAKLEDRADKGCPDGEVYKWSDKEMEYTCVPGKSPGPDPKPEPPKKKQSWCAVCEEIPRSNSCPPSDYIDWRPIPKSQALRGRTIEQVKCVIRKGKRAEYPPPYRPWKELVEGP
jgi:hypothetical protein